MSLPVISVVVAAWLWVLTDPVRFDDYAASVVVLGVALAGHLVQVRRDRHGPVIAFATAGVFLAAVGLLRQSAGGVFSGVAILGLLPVFQSALFGRDRRELWGVIVLEAALLLVPIVVVGGEAYPASQWRAGVLTVAVSGIIGLATQRLVDDVSREAREAHDGRRMLEQVNHLAHELFASGDVRGDLSSGALRISGASVAILFEPDPGGRILVSTAIAGASLERVEVPLATGNPVADTYLTGRRRTRGRTHSSQVALPSLWREVGSPETTMYQPLLRDGRAAGVLAIAWQAGDAARGARASVLELLAHEAALALERVDQVEALTGMAETDALTGLPNRRAWDARIAGLAHDPSPIVVAMLDIDHFKRFNDTHGHLAGDRLLEQTAAAWRELLRGSDMVARLGGEEFGVLLVGCDPERAVEVTERLRDAVSDGQTCSAGLAARAPREPLSAVLARADEALYAAKAQGRDLARIAV